jgi:ribose/xylose/arabinose/galactoside ABC-type transport system permease subunit
MQSLAAPRAQRHASAVRRLVGSQSSGLLLANIVLFVALSIGAPDFFTSANFQSTATLVAYTGVMSAVGTLVLIAGGLDLSVGAVAVLAGQGCAIALDNGWSTGAAIGFALVIGAGAGILNAGFIVGLGINPLIATIGTAFVLRGLALGWTDGNSTIIESQAILDLGARTWLGVPEATYVMLGVFALVGFILRFTRLGSNFLAAGSNPIATRRSGVAVWRTLTTVYLFSGVSAAFAGVMLIGFQGASIPYAAVGIELTVLSAVVLGGTGLIGGSGSIVGTLMGVILLAIVASGLTALSAEAYWALIVTGVVLILAMAIDDIRQRRSAVR